MALYDPQEFPEVKADPADFTLSDVLAWARTKPLGRAYDYISHTDCALCQFLKETGRATKPLLAGNDWYEADGPSKRHVFDERIDDAAIVGPATFGAFADRLEKALSC